MIEGGYYIKARKIQNSDIAFAPPHVREIWDWLIKEVNHKDNGNFKRGQTVSTLKDIQEGLKWFVGYRKEMYSKSKCGMAMNWLRKRGMITTAKTTRGMIITICKYDTYQNPKNYETNNEKTTKPTRNEQPSDTINKKEKKEKKEIIHYLNFVSGKSFKITTAKTNELITARINEGFTLDNFKSVIDIKCREWLNTEHEKYIRPETLFGNKFEGYLNSNKQIPIKTNKEYFSHNDMIKKDWKYGQ